MKNHKETFYKNNSDTIVVFIHGITESPNQFKDMNKTVIKKVILILICFYQDTEKPLKILQKMDIKNGQVMLIIK